MTTGLIQPIPTVQAAIKAGLIRIGDGPIKEVSHGDIVKVPISKDGSTPMLTFFNGGGGVKTPEEAGIARLPICHKQDKRRLPKPKQVRRYIITQKELRAQGFSRQEIQHIKNEVRSQ